MLKDLIQKMVDIYEYTPLQVKQTIVGYGRAQKKQVQTMVKNILKLDAIPKPDDAADALAGDGNVYVAEADGLLRGLGHGRVFLAGLKCCRVGTDVPVAGLYGLDFRRMRRGKGADGQFLW